MREPNFIIGGVAAGGTSYLYELLIQHSEIYLPKQRVPEPHYYYKSWEYSKGLQWYLKEYFSNVKEEIAVGERSSSYLYGGAKVAQKIAKDFPQMKFIFMLRNPIERAWANYRFTALQGLEEVSFKEALLNEKERIKHLEGIWKEIAPYDYTGRGFYAKQLQEFLDFFPKEQILCIKSESLSSKDLSLLPKIYHFLNLKDCNFTPLYAPMHTSLSVIDIKMQRELRKFFGDQVFAQMMELIRKEKAINDDIENKEKYIQLKNNIKDTKEKIPQDCIKILQDTFAEDLSNLQKIIDFDISDWLLVS